MMKPSPTKMRISPNSTVCVRLDVARGLEDDEQRVAVHVELRALVRLDRVLDRQLVQVELAPHRVELVLGRLVEADPDERVLLAARLMRVQDRKLARPAKPVLVDRAVDDHGTEYRAPG